MSEEHADKVSHWEKVAQELGILGFAPHCDAIKQPLHNGIRIWYLKDGQIRWVQRSTTGQDRWNAATDTSAEDAKKALSAADNFEVIDKRLFNAVSSHIEISNKSVNDGIVWGVVLHNGHKLRQGDVPYERTLQYVPGVGKKTARKIRSGLHGFPGTTEGRKA